MIACLEGTRGYCLLGCTKVHTSRLQRDTVHQEGLNRMRAPSLGTIRRQLDAARTEQRTASETRPASRRAARTRRRGRQQKHRACTGGTITVTATRSRRSLRDGLLLVVGLDRRRHHRRHHRRGRNVRWNGSGGGLRSFARRSAHRAAARPSPLALSSGLQEREARWGAAALALARVLGASEQLGGHRGSALDLIR